MSSDDKNYKIDTPDIEGMDADWDEDDFDVDVPAPAREQEQGETFDVPHGNLDEDDFDVDIPAPADRHSEPVEESQGQNETQSEAPDQEPSVIPSEVEESQGLNAPLEESAPADRHSEGSDSELEESQGLNAPLEESAPSDRHSEQSEESQGQSDTPSEAVSAEIPSDRHSEPVEESQGQNDASVGSTPSEAPLEPEVYDVPVVDLGDAFADWDDEEGDVVAKPDAFEDDFDDVDVDVDVPASHSEQSEESQGLNTPLEESAPAEIPADSHSEPVEESQGQSDTPSEAAPSDRHSEGSDSELEESQGQSDTPSEAVPSATSSEAPDQEPSVIPSEVEESHGQSDTPSEAPDSLGASDDVVLPDDEPTDEAKAAAEEAALENYRSSMGETDAELADVSAYRNFRKTTKTGGPDKSKNKQSDFDIFANRHKAKTINQAVAQSDPIVYFYNACLTAKGEVLVFNVYQVLQDRFIGKIIPQLFTAVAEASSKIEELNMASLLAAIPVCQEFSMYDFVISISCRFFTKPALLDRLLKALPQEVPSNLIFAFDSVSLQNLGMAAKTGLGAIREKGVKVMLDNTEKVSMTALTELDYDYIRIDSRYYEMGNPKAEAYLGMIINLAHGQGVKVVSSFCDNIDMCEYMLYMGVDAVQGNAVSKPFRTVPNAVKGITLLETMMDD